MVRAKRPVSPKGGLGRKMPQHDSDCPSAVLYKFLNPKCFPLPIRILNGVLKSKFCVQAGRTYRS